jgi:methylamine dehydrogenase accessory protein MauD
VTDALVVSNVVLWGVVLVLCGVVLALVRQIGILHERVAPAGALMVQGGPEIGARAPIVELTAWSGESLRVGAPGPDGRSTLVCFLSPTCPVCATLLPVLGAVREAERRWLRVVAVGDGERAEYETLAARLSDRVDAFALSAPLGLAYRVPKLPYAVLVDEAGVVRAAGLVNTREHLESLFEAKERGVASLQAFATGGGRQVA